MKSWTVRQVQLILSLCRWNQYRRAKQLCSTWRATLQQKLAVTPVSRQRCPHSTGAEHRTTVTATLGTGDIRQAGWAAPYAGFSDAPSPMIFSTLLFSFAWFGELTDISSIATILTFTEFKNWLKRIPTERPPITLITHAYHYYHHQLPQLFPALHQPNYKVNTHLKCFFKIKLTE